MTAGKPDQKEGIYFGVEHAASHVGVQSGWPMHGKNQWPEKDVDFSKNTLKYIEELTELGKYLMSLVAGGLGLDANYFRERFGEEPTTLFRMFNYPLKNSDDVWGVGEHTDMGFLTILLQDSKGGLQVKDRSGDWIDADPVEDTFVINIGDMLQHWTGGIHKANLHRVKNTKNSDRQSYPFFFDPGWTENLVKIDPKLLRSSEIDEVNTSESPRWDGLDLNSLSSDLKYGDFVWEKIKNVFPQLS